MTTKSRLRNKGKFRRSYWFHFSPLLYLIISILALALLQYLYTEDELVNPCEGGCTFNFSVRAYEEPEIVIEVAKELTIEEMIREAFPEDPDVAVAVSMSESHMIPEKTLIAKAGHYSWSSPTYKGECSVGLFMINLASDGCDGKWIHANKIQGETLKEKIEWLKVPSNNIKIARDIYDSRGGNFSAWSGYTGGGYLKHLK